ncbi:MAG: hypothetical protein JWR47_1858 [Phenylobacterium sp.]|jgi:hypothetical protein|nr:hypothetical protein [Phenylobacterium sp.]MDB5435601.1 hypothetical protein [Phenylobacterium sp.]
MKYAFAMLAAGGVVGVASEASATVVTLGYAGDPTSSIQDISLISGSPAQFYYGFNSSQEKTFLGAYSNGFLGGTYGSANTIDAGETFSQSPVKTAWIAPPFPGSSGGFTVFGDQYIHLQFIDAGELYVGEAHVDPNATLVDINFNDAGPGNQPGGIPEPASWALMIAGFGLAGTALRQRRRQAALSA